MRRTQSFYPEGPEMPHIMCNFAFLRLFCSRKMGTHDIHIVVIRHLTARAAESGGIVAAEIARAIALIRH
ncbi:hypothetical protein NXC24_CH00524 [Rhizobium sp. NXC24]|nr:hypothetical protein NXC24_CH00524 [Rhizobium sp. NXC24]